MYILREHYEQTRNKPHYKLEKAVTHRGKAGMKYFEERGFPPLAWFESPARSAETIVAVSNIRVVGKSVCYDCIISTNIYSPYYKETVDMDSITVGSNVVWLDC